MSHEVNEPTATYATANKAEADLLVPEALIYEMVDGFVQFGAVFQ